MSTGRTPVRPRASATQGKGLAANGRKGIPENKNPGHHGVDGQMVGDEKGLT
jgi:hypothetical protein